jgi:Flp pilus assembly protein TadG
VADAPEGTRFAGARRHATCNQVIAMPTTFLHRLRGLPKDERAATAVEFAILIAPLMFLLLASLQLGIIFFAQQCLQSAATASARKLMTGSVQQQGLSQTQFQSAVCANAPVLFSCGAIMVDVQSTSSYSSVSTATLVPTYDANGNVTNSWSYSPGGAGDIVIMRVMYNWPVVAAPLLPGLANQPNGNRLLVATSVFKNEPFQ